MAKTIKKKNIRSAKKAAVSPFNIYWKKKNYIFLSLGFILLLLGYYLMSIDPWNSTPALYFSPVILVIAYVVIFPASILFRGKKDSDKIEEKETEPQNIKK